PIALDRVAIDPGDRNPGRDELTVGLAKLAKLAHSPRRPVQDVEEEHERRAPDELTQGERPAVGIRKREIGEGMIEQVRRAAHGGHSGGIIGAPSRPGNYGWRGGLTPPDVACSVRRTLVSSCPGAAQVKLDPIVLLWIPVFVL